MSNLSSNIFNNMYIYLEERENVTRIICLFKIK